MPSGGSLHARLAAWFLAKPALPAVSVRIPLLIKLLGVLFGLMLPSVPASALPALTFVSVNASITTAPYGSPITLTASVTSGAGTPDGTVIFLSDLVSIGSATLDGSGQATFNVSSLSVGVHAIVAIYVGNSNFLTSTAIALNINISLAACTIAVNASVSTVVLGGSVNLTATVTGGGGAPTGLVTFKAGASALGTATLNGAGQGTLTISASILGPLSIGVDYGGDAHFLGCTAPVITVTVIQATSATALSSSVNPAASGSAVTLLAVVTSSGPAPTGTVTFKDGAISIGTGSLNGSGTATLNTSSLALGGHSITAVYAGDTNVAASTSAPLAQTIVQNATSTALMSSANPATAGASVTFSAVVSGAGGTPTGLVTFKDGATVLGAGPLDGSGHASIASGALSAGTHAITAVYAGDSNFASSTSPVLNQISGQAPSTTALTVSPNPAATGTPVVFTVVVTGTGGTPSGAVTFRDGSVVIGTSPLNGTGIATLTVSSLGNGNHLVTATYSGDATFAASLSPAVMSRIGGGGSASTTMTTLASSANPALAGQLLTLTASVTATTGSPTGLVTFRDGGQIIGSAPLSGNIASLTVSTLTVGQHSITAMFTGNASFAISTSAPLSQSISMPPDSIKLRNLQVVASRIAAQNSGQAISGTIEAAVSEGFAGSDRLVTPSELGLRLTSSGQGKDASDWVVWSDLRQTSMNPGSKADIGGNQFNAFVGVTYRVMPDAIIGAFGGYETFGYDVASLSGRLRGDGATAGAYVGWRPFAGVRLDAGVARSAIGYRGAAGDALGNFSGSRTFVTAGITGTYKMLPDIELEPSARVFALWEEQGAYTDSLGVAQNQRNFSTGRASIGAKLIYKWISSANISIAPYFGAYADNYFNKDNASPAIPNVTDGASARLIGGVAVVTDGGLKVTTGGEIGGLAGSFTTWSFRTRGSLPF